MAAVVLLEKVNANEDLNSFLDTTKEVSGEVIQASQNGIQDDVVMTKVLMTVERKVTVALNVSA